MLYIFIFILLLLLSLVLLLLFVPTSACQVWIDLFCIKNEMRHINGDFFLSSGSRISLHNQFLVGFKWKGENRESNNPQTTALFH
jgi:hypothetical protein